MSEHLFAVLIHDRPYPFDSLRRTLNDLCVETYSVSTCKEAEELIAHCKPQIVFAGSSVEDGSWRRILKMAEAEDVPLSVIVVGSVPDTRHYVSVMELGAFDYVAPPFEHEPLNFVIRSAALDALRRRRVPSGAAYA